MVDGMTVYQVAFSVLDLERTLSWYQDAFGFVASGGNTDQGGPEVAAMQGLPVCRCDELVARVTSGGQTVSHAQMSMGSAVVRYLTGASDVSVEVLAIPDPAIERAAGFLPPC